MILVHFEAKWPKTRFLRDLERSILESRIDQFLLQMCQNTHIEWDYDILNGLSKKIGSWGTVGRQKSGHFSVMKYFGFIILTRSVLKIKYVMF